MALIRISRGVPKYNIQIGKLSDALESGASAIVSVTDSFDDTLLAFPHFHWLPINEMAKSWGYMPFYSAKKILDGLCLVQKMPLVYLCCSGGIHRSPLTAFCWMLSMPGATPENVEAEFYGQYRDLPGFLYQKDVSLGVIPNDLPAFYRVMDEHPTFCLQGILQAMNKYERISYVPSESLIKSRLV